MGRGRSERRTRTLRGREDQNQDEHCADQSMSCNEGAQLTIVARWLAREVRMRVCRRDGREIGRRGPPAVLVTLLVDVVVVVPRSRWTQMVVVVMVLTMVAAVQGCHGALQEAAAGRMLSPSHGLVVVASRGGRRAARTWTPHRQTLSTPSHESRHSKLCTTKNCYSQQPCTRKRNR